MRGYAMTKCLLEVTHRGITADHYMEGKKYMVWLYHHTKEKKYRTLANYQVRAISEPLTEEDLRNHIDKYIEGCLKEIEKEKREESI